MKTATNNKSSLRRNDKPTRVAASILTGLFVFSVPHISNTNTISTARLFVDLITFVFRLHCCSLDGQVSIGNCGARNFVRARHLVQEATFSFSWVKSFKEGAMKV